MRKTERKEVFDKKDMRILRERVSRKNDSEVLLSPVLSKSGRLREAQEAAEEAAKREQAAYYKGWQDGKQYYLDEFGGIN